MLLKDTSLEYVLESVCFKKNKSSDYIETMYSQMKHCDKIILESDYFSSLNS